MYLFLELLRMIVRALAVFGAIALGLAVLFVDFLNRSDVGSTPDTIPRTAIVFTGQYDRIHLGLDILTAGRVDRLFITGVNGPAGLDMDRFARQFELTPEQVSWLETGKIILAEDANNTFGNAWEAGCWVRGQEDIDAVTLITERSHMPRASIALRHEIWPVHVARVYTDALEDHDPLLIDLQTFGEYLATWGITLLPNSLWPADEPAICQTGAAGAGASEPA